MADHGPRQLIGDRFEIGTRWASGSMTFLYRARDRETGEAVLLKMSSWVEPERFHHESVMLARFCHPRILRYIAHGTTPEGEPYLVTEALEGTDLQRQLGRSTLAIEESSTIARGAAEALAALHASGFVHRDVKPANLFLCGGDPDRVKLFNFELVCRVHTPTAPGEIFGTPSYMAPEQVRGEPRIDAPADIFALGGVLFECLTGRPPFTGTTIRALLKQVLSEDAPRLRELRPDTPPGLDDLLARMLARDPSQRPRDGAALLAELDRLEAEWRLPS